MAKHERTIGTPRGVVTDLDALGAPRKLYELVWMPLSLVRGLARNPKDHDIGAIIESVQRFGFVEPVQVNQTTRRLVHGHGRDEALTVMREAGMAVPKGIQVDEDTGEWLLPGYIIRIPESDEEALTIALNRTGERGGWHHEMLGQILQEIAAQGEAALRGTGFDLEDVAFYEATFNFPDLDEVSARASAPLFGDYVRLYVGVRNHLEDAIGAFQALCDEHPEWEAHLEV